MPLRGVVLGAICAVAAAVVGACGPQQGSQEPVPSGSLATSASGSSPSAGISVAWPIPGVDSSELQPTGWLPVGVPRPEDYTSLAWLNGRNAMVADGAGHVWIRSGWQVIRLDPASGETTSWDVADDALFATPGLTLASASGSGVWLVEGGRIRLFDGARFAVDLQLPQDMLDLSDPVGRMVGSVIDIAERGSELWLSLDFTITTPTITGPYGGQVVKWSGGRWSEMSGLADGIGGDLAVDSRGRVWACGHVWDGNRWELVELPAAEGARAPAAGSSRAVASVKADRDGAVWFINEASDGGLYRYDGNHWQSWSSLGEGWAKWAVSGDGDAWVVVGVDGEDRDTVTRVSADGTMKVFGLEHGLSGYIGDVEVTSGGDVVLMTGQGTLRLSENRFTRIWQDNLTDFFGTVVAVSGYEVWAGSFRFDGEEWSDTGLEPSGICPSVLATDGAVWVATGKGLIRQAGDRRTLMGTRVDECRGMVAGEGGAVWLAGHQGLTRYSASGAQKLIPWPGRTDHECLKAAGADGSVWVSAETDPGESGCDDPRGISRWDGRRWTPVEALPAHSLGPMAVADDGAAWATSWQSSSPLARFATGHWSTLSSSWLGWLTAVSGGRVCGMEQSPGNGSYVDAIVCFAAKGEVARIDLRGMGVRSSSIAPDGSIWVVGDEVARLDETLPMG